MITEPGVIEATISLVTSFGAGRPGINAVVIYDQGRYHAQLGAFSDRARAISVADEVNQRGYSVTIRH